MVTMYNFVSAETAHELQAALDRLEHEASNTSSTRKVRFAYVNYLKYFLQ